MKKRLVFEYDDAVERMWSLSALFQNRGTKDMFLRDGYIEDAEPEKPEPEKPEPNLAEALELFRELEKMCDRALSKARLRSQSPQPEPLKPCPAGHQVFALSVDTDDAIRCTHCGFSAPNRAAWNRRAS